RRNKKTYGTFVQRIAEGGDCAKALLGIVAERDGDGIADAGGNFGGQRAQTDRPGQAGLNVREVIHWLEGRAAGEHPVENERRAVDVAAMAYALPFELLGRHVLRRAEALRRRGETRRFGQ